VSDMRDEAVEKIMEKFFNYVLVTCTWFVNYAERRGAPAEKIEEMRTELKKLKDMIEDA